MSSSPASKKTAASQVAAASKNMHKPFMYPPCANHDGVSGIGCPKRGAQVCAACHLVSYCSKDCQTKHWSVHKLDCKDRFGSNGWRPAYMVEKRAPEFHDKPMGDVLRDRNDPDRKPRLDFWGEQQVMDLIRLQNNEKDTTKDLNLAILGGWDLRDLVETVLNLPENYTGRLTFVVSDADPVAICRNAMLLLILGTCKDANKAAEMALHFWYSAFLPLEYHQAIMDLFHRHQERLQSGQPIPLGGNGAGAVDSKSELRVALLDPYCAEFEKCMTINPIAAQKGYREVRRDPYSTDATDNWYLNLKGTHRLACRKYIRFGIVQPFGAPTSGFGMANGTLFSTHTGTPEWALPDLSDPLSSYPIEEVVKAGRKLGAPSDDLYGCLYFYLINRFKIFKARLAKFNISVRLTRTFPWEMIPAAMKRHEPNFQSIGLTSMCFDRVQLYSLCDHELDDRPRDRRAVDSKILKAWVPLLKKSNKNSVILATFRRWPKIHPDALDTRYVLGEENMPNFDQAIGRAIQAQLGWVYVMCTQLGLSEDSLERCLPGGLGRTCSAFYDTYPAFYRYLVLTNFYNVMDKLGLSMRRVNRVVPNRIGVPPGKPQDATPELGEDPETTVYYALRLDRQSTWMERFTEISRV